MKPVNWLPLCKAKALHFTGWWLLLLLVNVSIDTPDLPPLNSSEIYHGEEIDNIESICELVSELCFFTPFPESDEESSDKSGKTFDLYCITPACRAEMPGFCSKPYIQRDISKLFKAELYPITPPPRFI